MMFQIVVFWLLTLLILFHLHFYLIFFIGLAESISVVIFSAPSQFLARGYLVFVTLLLVCEILSGVYHISVGPSLHDQIIWCFGYRLIVAVF